VSRLMPISVGQSTSVSDPRTSFEQLIVSPSNRLDNDALLGDVIETPPGNQTLVRVTAEFDVTGTYAFSARIVPDDAARWTVALSSSTQTPTQQGPANPKNIIVQLTAVAADNLASRVLEIHAARTGPGDQFDSWFAVAIRNG
jgi:hypothetical protein